MTNNDAAELLRVVAADLRYLQREWTAPDVDDDTLRRGSATLGPEAIAERYNEQAAKVRPNIDFVSRAT